MPGETINELQLGAVYDVGNIIGAPACEKTADTLQDPPLPQIFGIE